MGATITVGYDGSCTAEHALHWAAEEATFRGVPVRIVACHEDPPLGRRLRAGGVTEALEREARALADCARSAVLGSHPDLHVTSEGHVGAAAPALTAGRSADDLVVVGAGRQRNVAPVLGKHGPRSRA